MSSGTDLCNQMIEIGKRAREAASVLALTKDITKNQALFAMAIAIRQHEATILQANKIDITQAKEKSLSAALIDRLVLDPQRLETMATALETIAHFPDPVGRKLVEIKRPNGLDIIRLSVPIGVIGVIYESRPNVTSDAAGLCIKSGNAVILRGGSESFHSSSAIMAALHEGINQTILPPTVIQMIPTIDRAAVSEMLKLEKYIDVIIPRGGQQLIERLSAESRIPLFKHLAGLCHTYIHHAADLTMSRKIIVNAKMRRTGVCGATEVLLIDRDIVHSHLPAIINDLIIAGCEVRGDENIQKIHAQVKQVVENDYHTEFLAPIIAIKIVDDLSAAIQHIAEYGTQHTDAIITEDTLAAEKFLQAVDSAIVMHNTSTQFADGGEFGMGAEIGIATGKLHARGPVGLEQLTTFKYIVRGQGQVR
ncbi:MAG: glutamate-5-semialdehyde dehydrogenase [Gammaproteobacteria bacterium RIFCSPHIGHO2_12_FULL_37_14]|nr:MAG: glutamate-5-semialdehyde dehydrogenase [Gammaproteobacteria bacterium RIFCSPHIGHO2_12_FULL_37_14]